LGFRFARHTLSLGACYALNTKFLTGPDTVLTKFQSHATMPSELLALTQQRLVEYINLYTIAIAQTPTQRYQAMLVSQPDKLARIPLHILASYLGVTPVHLSRIRRRLKSGPGSQAF
ncbi:Crp/Fnr family transcriptional regulator, partial [Burkholderia multivorans]|uniref:Crp/Fnr family transcriptional regulator n=2 Tax=Burkholderia multivorans TaxID=87883 RepID=UPI000D3A7CB4